MSFKASLILLHQFKSSVSFFCSSCPRTFTYTKQEFLFQRRPGPARPTARKQGTQPDRAWASVASAQLQVLEPHPHCRNPWQGVDRHCRQVWRGPQHLSVCASSSVHTPAAMVEPQVGHSFHTSKCTTSRTCPLGRPWPLPLTIARPAEGHRKLLQQVQIQVNRDICASGLAGAWVNLKAETQ